SLIQTLERLQKGESSTLPAQPRPDPKEISTSFVLSPGTLAAPTSTERFPTGMPQTTTLPREASTSFDFSSSTPAAEPPDQAPLPRSLTTAVSPETNVPEATEQRSSAVSDSSIRVDVGLLDKLMNLVGELVLARNQLVQYTTAQES